MVDVNRVEVESQRGAQARKTVKQDDGIEPAAQAGGDARAGMQIRREAGADLGDEVTWARLPCTGHRP